MRPEKIRLGTIGGFDGACNPSVQPGTPSLAKPVVEGMADQGVAKTIARFGFFQKMTSEGGINRVQLFTIRQIGNYS